MWNKPQLMTAVSDLLFVAAAAALLVAGVVWSTRLPLFPLREVVVLQDLHEVKRSEVEAALDGRLLGNFFSVDLNVLRQSLEQLPWVRHADLRRRWPSRIEVNLEEHVPVAYWGQASGQLVNSYGEVFTANLSRAPSVDMPVLVGPTGMAPEMLGYFQQAEDLLKPIGRQPRALNVSLRQALQVKLDDGMVIELGREQAKAPVRERLARFVAHYHSVLTAARQRPSVVDMRYPNGFALRLNASAVATATDNKGKP